MVGIILPKTYINNKIISHLHKENGKISRECKITCCRKVITSFEEEIILYSRNGENIIAEEENIYLQMHQYIVSVSYKINVDILYFN